MTISVIAQKAFAAVEAIGALETALWKLYYEEFLTICEMKSEKLCDNIEENIRT